MPLQIIRNDITKVKADAIVNTANPMPVIGAGTDSAVYKAAGEEKLLAARMLIGEIRPGRAIETSGYNLAAKYIIHTVCVEWRGGRSGELDVLAECYDNSLKLAAELNCRSVAFPLIGTGSYGFPRDDAIGVAKDRIRKFLKETGSGMKVMIVLFDQASVRSGAAVAGRIREYIDDNYVENAVVDEYGFTDEDLREMTVMRRRRERIYRNYHASPVDMNDSIFMGLDEDVTKTFVEKVFEYIEALGIKDSELYGGKYELYFSKQVLTNMRKDPDYHPAKYVCIVICLVLKLDLLETLDLLERAGYTLSRSRKADVVVRACIENGVYDIFAINERLDENNCDELRQIK
ncbi:O-acetyl-ADP-ribose deacetylase (regulator of RNase III), contains Macro domain [Ruminococcaceae bacterium YRB3002]|nr:O-acetyl-ADP-ribose deacetylase (regulator of RNase III), contains Macro domain [Ruminococcaceae bacterium YRB3002]